MRLLLQHMDHHQRKAWLHGGRFEVVGSLGGKYTLDHTWVWKGEAKYCLQPTIHVPTADAVLARMLLIQADERRFLREANAIDWP